MLSARARPGSSMVQGAAGRPCLSVAAHINCCFRIAVRTKNAHPRSIHPNFPVADIFLGRFCHSIYRCISVPISLSHSRTTCMKLPPPKPKAQILESSSMHVPLARRQCSHPLGEHSPALRIHSASPPLTMSQKIQGAVLYWTQCHTALSV